MIDAIRATDAARADYSSARNCAESVLRAVQAEVELPGVHEAAGSGFTSGIGNTGCLCGALAGGVMMLGAYAETESLAPEARRLRAEALSAEFLERFTERWGATCCRVIKRGYVEGSRASAERCADITEHAASLALEMIGQARGTVARRYGSRDVTAAAQRLAVGSLAGASVGLIVVVVTALSGASAAWLLVAGWVAGLAAALLGETGSPRARRSLRALRAIGLAAGALTALIVAFSGQMVGGVLADVLAGVAVPLVGLSLLVLALVRGYEFVRYR